MIEGEPVEQVRRAVPRNLQEFTTIDRLDARVATFSIEVGSSFSILTQLDYSNSVPLVIRAGSFFPAPRVDSAVVVMKRKESPVRTEDRAGFLSMIRALFSQRRKTVRNNLISSPVFSQKGREHIENAFSSLGLTGGERAETLSMDTLVSLYDSLK